MIDNVFGVLLRAETRNTTGIRKIESEKRFFGIKTRPSFIREIIYITAAPKTPIVSNMFFDIGTDTALEGNIKNGRRNTAIPNILYAIFSNIFLPVFEVISVGV